MLHLPPRLQQTGLKVRKDTDSHKAVLNLACHGPVILNKGFKHFTILPKPQILEFHGEIDILLADDFQNIIL